MILMNGKFYVTERGSRVWLSGDNRVMESVICKFRHSLRQQGRGALVTWNYNKHHLEISADVWQPCDGSASLQAEFEAFAEQEIARGDEAHAKFKAEIAAKQEAESQQTESAKLRDDDVVTRDGRVLPSRGHRRQIERMGLHPTDLGYDDPDAFAWGF